MSDARVPGYGERHRHDRSHGESLLDVITGRFGDLGLYMLDEPESALSFQSCLARLHVLAQVPATGSQVVCATHSPVLTALPGARIIELTTAGVSPVAWSDLAMVQLRTCVCG
jgi:predicted ATPase